MFFCVTELNQCVCRECGLSTCVSVQSADYLLVCVDHSPCFKSLLVLMAEVIGTPHHFLDDFSSCHFKKKHINISHVIWIFINQTYCTFILFWQAPVLIYKETLYDVTNKWLWNFASNKKERPHKQKIIYRNEISHKETRDRIKKIIYPSRKWDHATKLESL